MQTRTTQLEQVIEAYFAACDATRERFPLKSGGFSERQTPCGYGHNHAARWNDVHRNGSRVRSCACGVLGGASRAEPDNRYVKPDWFWQREAEREHGSVRRAYADY